MAWFNKVSVYTPGGAAMKVRLEEGSNYMHVTFLYGWEPEFINGTTRVYYKGDNLWSYRFVQVRSGFAPEYFERSTTVNMHFPADTNAELHAQFAAEPIDEEPPPAIEEPPHSGIPPGPPPEEEGPPPTEGAPEPPAPADPPSAPIPAKPICIATKKAVGAEQAIKIWKLGIELVS